MAGDVLPVAMFLMMTSLTTQMAGYTLYIQWEFCNDAVIIFMGFTDGLISVSSFEAANLEGFNRCI